MYASMCVSVFVFVCVCCVHDDSLFLRVGAVGCLCRNSKCALSGGGRRVVGEELGAVTVNVLCDSLCAI